MASDNEIIDGNNTPNGKQTNANKRFRFDANRSLNESDSAEELQEQLLKEKSKNKDLQFMVGRMQGKLDELTKQIEKLTTVITEMQNEKKQLIELFQKKSPNAKDSKEKRPKKKVSRKILRTPKLNETDVQAKNNVLNESKRDSNSDTASTAQLQLTQPSASHQYVVNDSEMSEAGKQTTPTILSDNVHSEDESSSDSSDDETVNTNEKNRTNTFKRSSKIPPVDIWCGNRSEIQNAIQSAIPSNSCLYQRINNNKFRVLPMDIETRQKVIDFAKEQNIEYNTYTPSEEKMINVLIKGLDHIEDQNVIVDALAEKGFVPHKIQKHVTGYMRKNNIKSNLWLIVLQPNTDTKELFKIKSIESAIIKFEFLRKPKVIQCKRCQRFNHSASNCFLPYRCVKCTDKHDPGKCMSQTKGNKFKPKCVNCLGNHTANDAANCSVFKKIIESKLGKQKVSDKQPVLKPTNQPSAHRTTQSYADRIKMNKQQNKTNNIESKGIDLFIINQNKILSDFMRSIKQMQQQFISNFNRTNG